MPDNKKDPSGLINQVLSTAAGATIGTGMGLLMEGHNDRRQVKQQRKLMDLEIAGQKQMSDYNLQKQLELWEKTGYGAQMDQIKKAGLNPALLYGMGGGGGQTAAAQPGHVSGGDAPKGGMEVMMATQTMLQQQMMQAQIESVKVNTEKTKAEIPNVEKTGENIDANTQNVLQTTQNLKQQMEILKIDEKLGDVELAIKSATQNTEISKAMNEAAQVFEHLKILENEHKISDATYKTAIKQYGATLSNTYADTALKLKGIQLSDAQIRSIHSAIAQGWERVTNETMETFQHKRDANNEQFIKELHALGAPLDIAKDIAGFLIFRGILGGNNAPKPIEGFKTGKNK